MFSLALEDIMQRPNTVTSGFSTVGIYPFHAEEPYNHPDLYTAVAGTEPIDEIVKSMGLDKVVNREPSKPMLTASPDNVTAAKALAKYLPKEVPHAPIAQLAISSIIRRPGQKPDIKIHVLDDDLSKDILYQKVIE